MVTLATFSYGSGRMTGGANHADRFKRFLESLQQSGIRVDPQQSGGFANRNIRGTNTRSQHAHGNAVDVNWTANPEGHVARPPQGSAPFDPNNLVDNAGDRPGQEEIPGEVARALGRRHGLRWGGDFQGRSPDPMHFEVNGPDLSTPSSATTAYPEGPGGPPQAPTQSLGPPVQGPSQGPPQAPFGANMMNNPMLMAGLSILGTTPGQSWGPAAAQAIDRAQRSGMQQNEYQRVLNQRQQSERVWGEAFPNGRANMQHPLLRGVPEDLANTVLAMGPDEGLPALQKFALTRSTRGLQDALIQSQIRRNDAQSQSSIQRGQAREMDAETRRRVANYDTFIDRFGSGNVTEAQWNAENQEGGIIHAALGRMVPFAERDTAVQEVQDRRGSIRAGPEDEDYAAAGLSQEQVRAAKRQDALRRIYGRPKVGHVWELNEAGQPYQRLVQESNERGTIPMSQLQTNLENLNNAFRVIAGTTNESGRLTGDGANIASRGMSQIPGAGGYLQPGLAEAYQSAEHAALTLSYALSGKQVGQAEQARIIKFFVPTWTDSNEISAFKLNAARQLFQRLMEAKRSGVTDASRAEMFDSEMERASRELIRLQNGGTAAPPERGDVERPPRSTAPQTAPRSGGGRDNDPLGIR